MSRFSDDGYDEFFPNQAALWEANLRRAISGKRGQRTLRDLEEALLALPEKRLISNHLALNGQVCAVGALVVHRRTRKGEQAETVLADLEEATPPFCECSHPRSDHPEDGPCAYRSCIDRPCWDNCQAYRYSADDPGDGGGDLRTAEVGKAVGVTFALAYHLAYLNDGRWAGATPEQRYELILGWARDKLAKAAA